MISNIGDKIRYLRDKAGFTQSYLAKKLGISRSAVNSWEMSLSSPSLSNIIEMMELFHVTADYLLGTSDKIMLDISNLSTEEQEVIIKLINCFKTKEG